MKTVWVRRGMVLLVVVLVGGILAVRLADYFHARIIEHRYRQWNASISRDAHQVRMDFQPIEKGEGDVAILFVPGFASPPALYRHFVSHFADLGFACRAMRLPGFGETVEQAAEVTRADWIEAVRREAAGLREDRDRVWIVAHSLGAAITLRALHDDPELADGLVLLAPLLRVSAARSPVLKPDDWFAFGERLLTHTRMTESFFPLDAHDERLRAADERDLFTPVSIHKELFKLLDELSGRSSVPDIPVMLVLSERDQIIDGQAALEWFEALDPPTKQLVTVDPAGHLLPLDTGWEDVMRSVEAFLVPHSASPPDP